MKNHFILGVNRDSQRISEKVGNIWAKQRKTQVNAQKIDEVVKNNIHFIY